MSESTKKIDFILTDEMKKELLEAGIHKNAIEHPNRTLQSVLRAHLPEKGELMLREAEAWLSQVEECAQDMREQAACTKRKCAEIQADVEMVKAFRESGEKFGTITDERARNALALFAQILSIAKGAGADAEDAVTNAGYAVYAYLGGQAKRETTYVVDKGGHNES